MVINGDYWWLLVINEIYVVETMQFLPTMTGNGNRATYGDDWGMVYYSLNHSKMGGYWG